MRKLGYYVFKYWISIGLFFYYKKMRMVGLDNVPINKPVLFLSNHQNALLDILPIATRCNRKPWYLTRADVFENRLFGPLFYFLQMLPVYRIRDGKKNLSKNVKIFEKCGMLLNEGEAILLFPEANHSLKRKVRPLSKGFTRIIQAALAVNPNIDLQLIPIGQNYQNPKAAGDNRSIYFGKPIPVKDFFDRSDFVPAIKQEVFEQMTLLTTHIANDFNYENTIAELNKHSADFTYPEIVNQSIIENDWSGVRKKGTLFGSSLVKLLFVMANLPFVFLWRLLLKPLVPEPEFEATFRFGFSLLAYTAIYLTGFVVLSNVLDIKTACLILVGHAAVNLLLVKIGITS